MMAQRRLNDLLKEDQEPFQLKSYIADRRAQLQKQLRKRKPISETTNFPGKLCKNACFFSFHGSPELRRSPLFDFASSSDSKSPKNAVFLHIPARTTALLLEAALRVQKKSSPKTNKARGFGILESILKRLANRKIEADEKVRGTNLKLDGDRKSGRRYCSGSTPSSAVWSEVETSSSGQSEDSREILTYCESPFRFNLHRTPEILSPPACNRRNKTEEKEKYDMEMLKKLEEEKEHSSPVCVLDAPFEDDDNENEDSFDIHESYAIVQRSKQHLLQKLRRFEKLAELDPIELEKRLLENEDDTVKEDEEHECEDNEGASSHCEESVNGFGREDVGITRRFHQDWKVPKYMKQLVLDLICEEEKHEMVCENSSTEVMRRVVKRVDSWEEVESNTIDMMVEQDFRRDCDVWKRNHEEVGESAAEIELAIFGVLVEEMWKN